MATAGNSGDSAIFLAAVIFMSFMDELALNVAKHQHRGRIGRRYRDSIHRMLAAGMATNDRAYRSSTSLLRYLPSPRRARALS